MTFVVEAGLRGLAVDGPAAGAEPMGCLGCRSHRAQPRPTIRALGAELRKWEELLSNRGAATNGSPEGDVFPHWPLACSFVQKRRGINYLLKPLRQAG